jgi:hypothetical protein
MAEADYDDEMSAGDIKVRCREGGGRRGAAERRRCSGWMARAAPSPAASPRRPRARWPRWQAALLDSLFGTERGLAARSEVRAEINELITQLEAKNPNPSPTEVCVCLGQGERLAWMARRVGCRGGLVGGQSVGSSRSWGTESQSGYPARGAAAPRTRNSAAPPPPARQPGLAPPLGRPR